ncbi:MULTISPECIES: energy transducer TonB [unclassified Sphingomonas]|jgi:periplasmic protein TonB|uniref:energy transducer TonB n=1 Tax=unclassified Sphingomonas TaxID=196159 RepID=UPI000E10448E|nr:MULTISPECIES: energy transducer TonB [unclassified Sphingomonas]AXJ95082.1 hypothetical protein DM480_05725 [Sphingomonas sp. FARSPH]
MNRAMTLATTTLLTFATPAMARDRSAPPQPLGSPAQWFGADNYPPAAMRAGEQGRVFVRLSIDNKGSVTDCVVQRSSGFPDLDNATCVLAHHHGLFAPATDRKGRPVKGQYDLPGVMWRINPAADVVPAPDDVVPPPPAG